MKVAKKLQQERHNTIYTSINPSGEQYLLLVVWRNVYGHLTTQRYTGKEIDTVQQPTLGCWTVLKLKKVFGYP